MAARARTRPRTARAERSPRSKKRNPNVLSRLNRPDVIGTFAAIAALVAALFVPAVQQAIGEGRDWTLRTFGLGIFIVLAWVLLAGADANGLEQLFSTARARRDAWLDSLLPPGE